MTGLRALSQAAALNASQAAASSVLKRLDRVGEVRKRQVQQARFVVLKSPDIPSMLVETAYISNPGEEHRLRSREFRGRIATAIRQGLRDYFYTNPPAGTRIAQFADKMPQNLLENLADDSMVDTLLDLLASPDENVNWGDYKNFFLIGIKPFMDAQSYDQDRADRCCVHVVDRAGHPVSLCEYNTLRRPRGLL